MKLNGKVFRVATRVGNSRTWCSYICLNTVQKNQTLMVCEQPQDVVNPGQKVCCCLFAVLTLVLVVSASGASPGDTFIGDLAFGEIVVL